MECAWSGSGTMTSTREEDRGNGKGEEEDERGEGIVTKRPSVEEDGDELRVEEDWDELEALIDFRRFWVAMYGPFVGDLKDTTGSDPDIGPKRYTVSGPPLVGGVPYDALEIFSVKVIELKDGLEWPIRVFGLIAVRDSMDHKRNVLFERSEDNCQTLTSKDSSLELIGPNRAIALIDPPHFEVELRVIGTRPSEQKLLCGAYFEYDNMRAYMDGNDPLIQTFTMSGKGSTVELKWAHMGLPLEATIEIRYKEGSSDFSGRFFAHVDCMGEDDVVLLDSSDQVTFDSDGHVMLSRHVVLVGKDAKLIVGVKAWQNGDDKSAVEDRAVFPTRQHSESEGFLNVGFCKMSVSVAWSVLT